MRIAMTVAEHGEHKGELREVTKEIGLASDEPKIELATTVATINADLSVGASVSATTPLLANRGISVRRGISRRRLSVDR